LPDFSWHNVPKWEKIYAPNDHEIYQMPYTINQIFIKIYQYFFTRPPKIYPRRNFWYKNITSGNPVAVNEFEEIVEILISSPGLGRQYK
jgi:5-bromo-4-chloroindolyl phosphate hydrolysis protein